MNLYAYVKNNPTKYIDPSGKIGIPGAIYGAIAGGVGGFITSRSLKGVLAGAAVGAAIGFVAPQASELRAQL